MSNGCEQTIYSISRLNSFDNCPYAYNITYNEGDRGTDSVYTLLGSKIHELLEELQQEKITNEQALESFLDEIDSVEMIGFDFMSENVRNNYIDNISHLLLHFEPKEGEYFIEEEVFVDIGDYKLRGFIDIYFKKGNNTIEIIDYKTSTKFKKNEILSAGRQLVLYAIALKQKYPE